MKLIVGTRSPGKTREIRELFAGLPFDITFPADRLLEPLPEEADLERSMSYVENAVARDGRREQHAVVGAVGGRA